MLGQVKCEVFFYTGSFGNSSLFFGLARPQAEFRAFFNNLLKRVRIVSYYGHQPADSANVFIVVASRF
jgi:hypothetical protein